MDVKTVDFKSAYCDGPNSIKAELYFLIAKLLEAGPCRNASDALKRELEDHGLLPKRTDWLGNDHNQTYEEVCRNFSHITSEHLLQICRRLGPLVDKEVPTNVRGVHSLLGAGRQSLLRQKEDLLRKLSKSRYLVRQHHRPRTNPPDLAFQPNILPLLWSRELTGSIDEKNSAPSKLYSRVQLFCRTLGHLSAVYCVLFDRTGQYIFTGADDLLVKIWSAVTGRLLATLRGASAEIADLAVSFDNTLLAAGSCDKIVRVWCLRTTAPIAVLTGHGGTITSINFCPADRGPVRFLASTSSDGSVAFWEYVVESGQTVKFFPRPHKFNEKMRPGQSQMLCASFSPGGMFLATGCADHHVRVYAMFGHEGPERILEIEAHSDRVDSIQWANKGLRFISGSKDGTALLWRYEKQEWKTTRLRMGTRIPGQNTSEGLGQSDGDDPDLRAQKLKVTMVTWSRDDRWLITAVSDYTLKVWDSTTGILHKQLKGHEGETFVLEPHPHDPNVLLSGGHDGRLLIWDLAKGEVMKSFLNFIEGQGHGAVFDAKWSPSGWFIAATDSHGHLSIYGIGSNERFKRLPKAMFFHTDYRPLIRDAHHHVLDEQTQLAPHLMPPPFLVDSEGNPYPPQLQRLVPGREMQKDDQLIPTVIVNANGEQEILAGAQPPENVGAVMAPPPQPQRARSNIDQMIAELAHQQERQRNRPRSSSSSSSTAAAPTPSTEHSYASRHVASRSIAAISGLSSGSRSSQVENYPENQATAENEENGATTISTEATTSESLPGFSRRVIVKSLTSGQLNSSHVERQGWADEEVFLFYQEVQRKSPNIFLNSSTSPGVTALMAARSRGISDEGWSPSRPRQRPQGSNQGDRSIVSSPRARLPVVSAASRRTAQQSQQQQHNYRTRANRTENRPTGRIRERSRRVVRESSSEDGDEDVQQEDNSASEAENVEVRTTRSHARRQQRGEALSTSDSDDSDSDSDVASELLDTGSDSDSKGSSSSSEYSDWTAEAGVNLEPPKRTRRKVYRRPKCLSSDEEVLEPSTSAPPANDGEEGEGSNLSHPVQKRKRVPIPQPGSGGLDRIPESFRPSEWLSEVVPRRTPYYPQMGDEIIYFRQGHELYVDAVTQKKVFEINPRSLPWSRQNVREQELVKVIGIKYEIKPPRLCCLKLGLMDPSTGALTGESFTLKYHDMADVLDFLVLRQAYELAIQRNWKAGDRFRCIIDDLWWEGQVELQEPFHANCPDSMFLCYRVRWDNGEYDRMSPWDLEPIDAERRPPSAGAGVPVLPAEIAMTLYQPRAEDWPPGGDRDAECDRIANGISQVMSLAIAEPFMAPVDLNMYPSYAYIVEYPIDLSTIKARLENRFYRRVTAVQYDVRYIYTNACKFNEPKSAIVRHACIITDLCLEIIRNREVVDATALYHQLVENYRASPDGDEPLPGTSTGASVRSNNKKSGSAPNTPNTRLRSRRNSPDTDSDSDKEKELTKAKANITELKSKERKITTRFATVAVLSWKQQCKELVELLWRCEDAIPFREPVNILDHPDYLQIIDHPMDLQTIREQLQVGNYTSPLHFAKDVRLIFENSKNYNTNKKSRIYAMTVRLSAVFEEHIRSILASYKHKKDISVHSKGAEIAEIGGKGKRLLSLTSSHKLKTRNSRSGDRMNGEEEPRQSLKIVFSRMNSGQMAVQSSTSGIGEQEATNVCRRIFDDEETPSDLYVNGNGEPNPGPSGFSNSSSSNGTLKRGSKRRIVSSGDDESINEGEPLSEQTNGKGKSLKKPEPQLSQQESSSESSTDEDETPISLRRRLPVAKPMTQLRMESDKDDSRPTSSSSNSSNNSNVNSIGSKNSASSTCSKDQNGQQLRRSERQRRPPKRPLDSELSENDAPETTQSNRKRTVRTRNGGKRTVRYREDSEDEAKNDVDKDRNAGEWNRGDASDDDERGKRHSRKSAREAAKRLRPNSSSEESDDSDPKPTYSVSSRGRVRKLIHSAQEFYD